MPHSPAETDHALLLDCAAAARRIAPDRCTTDLQLGESCAWYHGFWPTLRALGIVTTPDTHRAFYADTLRALAADPASRRVLISGSADFSMLQQVYGAFDSAGADPEIVFLDRCPTPVALAERYAERTGRSVETHVGDILAFDSGPFDIVCTHSFMGYFTDTEQQALGAKWASLLRPGGKVVTINRVRPGVIGLMGFTPEQKALFVEKAQAAAQARAALPDMDIAEIVAAARRYADNFRIRPVPSLDTFRDIFEENGFALDLMDGRTVPGQGDRQGAGPTTPDGATYVHMVATRL